MQFHIRKIWSDPDILEGVLQALKISPLVPSGQSRHGWLTDEISWAGQWVPTVFHTKDLA